MINPAEKAEFIVHEEDAGKRLDGVLAARFKKFSKSYLRHQVDEGNVLVNSRPAANDTELKTGDIVSSLFHQDKAVIFSSRLPLSIIYEDEALIAVDKPSGMVVHPACGNYSDTLVNVLMTHFGIASTDLEDGHPLSFGIVTRLDKETSGVVLVSKTPAVQESLKKQLQGRLIKKEYFAFVEGTVSVEEGEITCALKHDPENRFRMAPDPTGKNASTSYKVIERFGGFTYLGAVPKTGRMHQIRAHLSHIGHPLAGDTMYGGRAWPQFGIERVMLHAEKISFDHPYTGKKMELASPLPADITGVLERLYASG